MQKKMDYLAPTCTEKTSQPKAFEQIWVRVANY